MHPEGRVDLLADLLRSVTGDVSYGFIDVESATPRGNSTADALEIDFLSFTDIRGRHVFVLKDVVNTGVIENYLLSQLRQHAPASLRLVALRRPPRRPHRRRDRRLQRLHDHGGDVCRLRAGAPAAVWKPSLHRPRIGPRRRMSTGSVGGRQSAVGSSWDQAPFS